MTTIPTIGFNVETVQPVKGLQFTVWDIGGQEKIRRLWRNYFQNSEGIFFLFIILGKTTVLYKIKLNQTVQTIPTIGFNVETVQPINGLTFTVWDIGGQAKIRGFWKFNTQNTEGWYLYQYTESKGLSQEGLSFIFWEDQTKVFTVRGLKFKVKS